MTWRPDPVYAAWGWQPRPSSAGLVKVELLGRFPRVAPEAVDAVKAMHAVLVATGYENPCDYVGSWNYRPVGGTSQLSRHAYGLAIDLDYGGDNPESPDHGSLVDNNPHLRRPITAADYGVTIQLLKHQVDAVLALRTNTGATVWRWLGALGDSMHFDIGCSPADLASGILATEQEGDNMDLERWVTRLRIPVDIDRMRDVGIITPDEANYWAGRQPSMQGPLAPDDPEWQDLRDAVEVRAVFWT